jgi:hypothetical protein
MSSNINNNNNKPLTWEDNLEEIKSKEEITYSSRKFPFPIKLAVKEKLFNNKDILYLF